MYSNQLNSLIQDSIRIVLTLRFPNIAITSLSHCWPVPSVENEAILCYVDVE